jgi:hypothetical protein
MMPRSRLEKILIVAIVFFRNVWCVHRLRRRVAEKRQSRCLEGADAVADGYLAS